MRASCPARVGIFGEGLLGPTLIAYGTDEQKRRFLEPSGWAKSSGARVTRSPTQGLTSPASGPKRRGDGDEWVINGQKVWTSLAQWADWCFVVARTDPDSKRHKGLSYLLVPMRQPGVEMRPITQLTGTSEFNEVFFDGARTGTDMVVGDVGDGWRVALATLSLERGVGLLGHQLKFRQELDKVIDIARRRGHDRPGPAATAGAGVADSFDPEDEHFAIAARARRPTGTTRGIDLEALLGDMAP